MKARRWAEWAPPFAPHVLGRYEADREIGPSGMPDPQQVIVACSVCKAKCRCPADRPCGCGAEWRASCTTGAVRTHVARFAALHLHRDPFASVPPHLSEAGK